MASSGGSGSERKRSKRPADASRARGTIRTPDLDARILEWIGDGGTLRSICRQPGMPSHSAVHEWRQADAEFAARYDEAKRRGYDRLAEEILEIADTRDPAETITVETATAPDGTVTTTRTVRSEDDAAHRKLRVYAREKLLAVWYPQKWAARLGVAHSGHVSFDALLQKVVDGATGTGEDSARADATDTE